MKYADLHIHTDFSDGTFTPEEVVRCAKGHGLSCIAICDHDCVDGIGPALAYAETDPIEIIPGVELSVIREGREIHVLGYYVSWKEKWFQDELLRVQEERIARLDKMIEKLGRANIEIDREKVLSIAGGKGSVGRLHLAQAMVEAKAVSSVQMAFEKHIGDFKPCYVEDIGFESKEAVEVILRAKGVPVLAHPHALGNDSIVKEFIKHGVRGIEAFHSDHTRATSRKYEEMARDKGLIVTGGSDCHGFGKNRVLMGSVKVSYELVDKLKEAAESVKTRG